MDYNYKTRGVCASNISFKIVNNKIYDVDFYGGCDGNLKAISSLINGKDITEVKALLKGIDCRGRGTSCSDQLVKAIEEIK